jgi:hypothetical protein
MPNFCVVSGLNAAYTTVLAKEIAGEIYCINAGAASNIASAKTLTPTLLICLIFRHFDVRRNLQKFAERLK